MSFGRLLSRLGCVIMGLGHSILSLRRLFLKRYVDDAKLVCLGALLGQPLVGILNQSMLTNKCHPYTALMADK
jgi:hypothetical protein